MKDLIKEFFSEPEEFVVGIVFALCWTFFIGWWVVFTAPICGFLWKMGGWEHGNRYYRRIGVPLLMLVSFWISLGDPVWLCLSLFGALSLGYGIPSPSDGDEGSVIGRFWYGVFKYEDIQAKREAMASAATRFTVGIACSVCMVGLCFYDVKGWWFGAIIFPYAFPVIERLIE